ncbi:MAG: T9SS C-terminal target domain-containing protein [Candidatus Zixiibacteriota bacterium]|nr:MAG: T9SS C-terminal target domain-containing protein [candidate division Zixibacteria bacterium]
MTTTLLRCLAGAGLILWAAVAGAQTTVYNNFGPDHNGWDYTYSMGWTVAGVNVPSQYGAEQAMGFTSTADGVVSDIWVAFFYVPFSTYPDTVTIMLAANPIGLPPEPGDVLEQWVITMFESWYQWTPPIHLAGSGAAVLAAGSSYWLWASAGLTTWTGWCLNVDPALTCPHAMRREGEPWLPIAYETASAFRVDVVPAAPVAVALTPVNPPIVIPAGGGSFSFDAGVENVSTAPQSFDLWSTIQVPGGSQFTALGPLALTLPSGTSLTRNRTQAVPGSAPGGEYFYGMFAGEHPWTVTAADTFAFSKQGGLGAWLGADGWALTGEPFPGEQPQAALIPSGLTLTAFPNPFNPETALGFRLSAPGHVSLKVYDTAGRGVTTLVDSWREAGEHQATFDASGLPSGIYFARLEAGEFSATQKLILVK